MSTPTARVEESGAVVVVGCKVVYILWPSEVIGLLLRDPQLWKKTIFRGKCHRRGLATTRRCGGPQGGPNALR